MQLQKRSRQPLRRSFCMFYNRTGRCNAKSSCPYVHDPNKVAVCLDFINGECVAEQCLLSHKVEPDKMPTCFKFLRGTCIDKACPYRHVMVSRTAPVCSEFLKGFCTQGTKCTKKHVAPKRARRRTSRTIDDSGGIDRDASGGSIANDNHQPEVETAVRRRDSTDVQMPRSFMKLGEVTVSSSSSSCYVVGL